MNEFEPNGHNVSEQIRSKIQTPTQEGKRVEYGPIFPKAVNQPVNRPERTPEQEAAIANMGA